MDKTGSESFKRLDFNYSGVELSGSTTREIII
jgi:hypothetical protein